MFRLKSIVLVAGIVAVMAALLIVQTAFATVVNINAYLHCNSLADHLQVNLPAGTYKATLINGPYTSWRWTSVSAGGDWNTSYYVLVSDGVTQYNGGAWVNAATALDGFNNTVNKDLYFTQPVNGIARFFVADNKCTDNSGGVSLEILLQPVPTESSTWGKVKALYR